MHNCVCSEILEPSIKNVLKIIKNNLGLYYFFYGWGTTFRPLRLGSGVPRCN